MVSFVFKRRKKRKKRLPETCTATRDQGVCGGLSGDLSKARPNPIPAEIFYMPEN